MKVPGRAWLEFRAIRRSPSETLLTQSAFFEPKGLLGLAYWYVLYTVHSLIFSGLIGRLAKDALTIGLGRRSGQQVVTGSAGS